MPALQVREFPEELYEELRIFAAAHYRNMAQQTVAAVEQMIHGATGAGERSWTRRVIPLESLGEREARLAKREAILARAAARRGRMGSDAPSVTTLVAEGRDERDADFQRIADDMMGCGR